MATILYKWLLGLIVFCSLGFAHPIYVSVTEVDYNANEKTVEISCKVFPNDFETALKQHYKTSIDLLNPKNKEAVEVIVSDYIRKNLSIEIDGKKIQLNFIGYEKIEEGLYCYLQATNISTPKKINITDKVLYDYKKEQVSVLHVTVNGERKSTKINNPVDKAEFEF
jgi:uncharacterized membrane protein